MRFSRAVDKGIREMETGVNRERSAWPQWDRKCAEGVGDNSRCRVDSEDERACDRLAGRAVLHPAVDDDAPADILRRQRRHTREVGRNPEEYS